MGRIVYSMQTSLDGYIEGPDGDIGLPVPEGALHQHFNEAQRRIAVMLCGRRMYEAMRFWDSPDRATAAEAVERDFAEAWRATPKVVVSTRQPELGPNATLATGDVEAFVRRLKAGTDGEISASGAELAGHLARWGLIDEYQLYVTPAVLGGGKPFFAAGVALSLRRLGLEQLTQDVTLLRYAPAG